jgi:Fur family ferric uptake transcriptional regulator
MKNALTIAGILKSHGLRDTQPRRLVIETLRRGCRPLSPQNLQKTIKAKAAINTVTVYRVLAVFEKIGLVHRHPCNGMFSLCTMPDTHGHHGFLHCHDCGKVEEFRDERLCKIENDIAKSAKFRPSSHVSEIVGTCRSCI